MVCERMGKLLTSNSQYILGSLIGRIVVLPFVTTGVLLYFYPGEYTSSVVS